MSLPVTDVDRAAGGQAAGCGRAAAGQADGQ